MARERKKIVQLPSLQPVPSQCSKKKNIILLRRFLGEREMYKSGIPQSYVAEKLLGDQPIKYVCIYLSQNILPLCGSPSTHMDTGYWSRDSRVQCDLKPVRQPRHEQKINCPLLPSRLLSCCLFLAAFWHLFDNCIVLYIGVCILIRVIFSSKRNLIDINTNQ